MYSIVTEEALARAKWLHFGLSKCAAVRLAAHLYSLYKQVLSVYTYIIYYKKNNNNKNNNIFFTRYYMSSKRLPSH